MLFTILSFLVLDDLRRISALSCPLANGLSQLIQIGLLGALKMDSDQERGERRVRKERKEAETRQTILEQTEQKKSSRSRDITDSEQQPSMNSFSAKITATNNPEGPQQAINVTKNNELSLRERTFEKPEPPQVSSKGKKRASYGSTLRSANIREDDHSRQERLNNKGHASHKFAGQYKLLNEQEAKDQEPTTRRNRQKRHSIESGGKRQKVFGKEKKIKTIEKKEETMKKHRIKREEEERHAKIPPRDLYLSDIQDEEERLAEDPPRNPYLPSIWKEGEYLTKNAPRGSKRRSSRQPSGSATVYTQSRPTRRPEGSSRRRHYSDSERGKERHGGQISSEGAGKDGKKRDEDGDRKKRSEGIDGKRKDRGSSDKKRRERGHGKRKYEGGKGGHECAFM